MIRFHTHLSAGKYIIPQSVTYGAIMSMTICTTAMRAI